MATQPAHGQHLATTFSYPDPRPVKQAIQAAMKEAQQIILLEKVKQKEGIKKLERKRNELNECVAARALRGRGLKRCRG